MTVKPIPPAIPFEASDSFFQDGTELFKDLMRIDTTNPPGDEKVAMDYAEKRLEEVGISSERFVSTGGRHSLMAHLGPNDENALILSAHLDVVPVDLAHWDHPPFQAVEADGCIYGRGAIDMKNMAAYALASIRELARSEAPLQRGLRVLLFADEETGCSEGSLAIARQQPSWLKGAVAVTEVGGFTTYVDHHRIYPIQVAEKGFVWFKLHIEGTPGHGSMPSGEGAVDELARIVELLKAQPFDFKCTQPAKDFLEGIAGVLGFPRGTVFKSIGNAHLSDFILEKLVRDPERIRFFRALLKDTVSPTIVTGGSGTNVVPSKATLTVDCRILPGTDPDAFIEEFKRRVPGRYTIELIDKGPPVVMDRTHPIMNLFEDILREADPGCTPVPQMVTGFTDARAFDQVGTPCYGFSPVWLPPEIPFASLFHGHNERIPVHGLQWGLACILELVRRVCVEGEVV